MGFNSRPPCDGRLAIGKFSLNKWSFNSRPPCDGRRVANFPGDCNSSFNSRPPCDGRQPEPVADNIGLSFNSRPPCDGRLVLPRWRRQLAWFQFTPALRRATGANIYGDEYDVFQFTPALRRATRGAFRSPRCTRCFNSRPPCDGRPLFPHRLRRLRRVSIHARLATGDLKVRSASASR